VIKALNEETFIERSIKSALECLSSFNGIVILADSGSVDKTIEIAKSQPVKIVQLSNLNERSCGVGAQLGYQYLDCEYVYILDGDMELKLGFLEVAIDLMQKDATLAGVAGVVEELGGGNYEFESRKSLGDGQELGSQNSLDMGGLYRCEALNKVQYLTNRNLHSYEEKELGERLSLAGYRLERISSPSVIHHGKTDESLSLLLKRWQSYHIDGPGEWMRSLFFKPGFLKVVLNFKQLWIVAGCWFIILLGILSIFFTTKILILALILHVLMILWLTMKKRSVKLAILAFIHLQMYAAGMIRGLFRAQKNPSVWIDSIVISGNTKN
jgi:glycosyltransferase involved in cell wall biosynthesis